MREGDTMTTVAPDSTTAIPTGTWNIDPVHSSIDFSARHMVVNAFRGEFGQFSGRLTIDASGVRIEGAAPVDSVSTRDPNLTAHLASPDFFDAERHPEVRFTSTDVSVEGDRVRIEGELTLKGITRPVTLTGSLTGPVDDPYGNVRVGLSLDGSIDRRDFDITWNAPLPGGGLALGNEVALSAQLELVRES
jgi:polyisoprenoid-binding protein YceI